MFRKIKNGLKVLSAEKELFLYFFLYLSAFLFVQYKKQSFPFSDEAASHFVNHVYIARNIFNLEPRPPLHVYAYPRLFHIPVFILYTIFSLSTISTAYLILVITFLSLIIAMNQSKRLGSHELGLIFIPMTIAYGAYARVIGVMVLLLYINSPSLLKFVLLGFGYPMYAPLIALHMLYERQWKNLFLGSVILAPYAFLLIVKNHGRTLYEPFDAGIHQMYPYDPWVPVGLGLIIYFLVILPVGVRLAQSIKDRAYYPDLTMPLGIIALGLLNLLEGWVFIYYSLLPIFSIINAKNLELERK